VERSGVLKVKVRVEVRDKHGKLVNIREKESDLILNNFKNMLATLLKPWEELPSTASRTASLITLGGSALNVPIWGNRTIGTGYGLVFTGAENSP